MEDSSMYSPYYTYSRDSLLCYAPMKTVHMVFAYIVGVSGVLCFLTRVIPSIRWTHVWWGRVYILSMLWSTATALLIYNAGMPTGVIVSVTIVMVALTFGWIAILVHRSLFQKQVLQRLHQVMAAGQHSKEASMADVLEQARADVSTRKTFVERMASLKTMHGVLMFVSFINIGRFFFSDPSQPYYCYTYPVYKPIDTPMYNGASTAGNGTLIPVASQGTSEPPWVKTGLVGWGLLLSLVPLAFGLIVAATAAVIDMRHSKKTTNEPSNLLGSREEVLQVA